MLRPVANSDNAMAAMPAIPMTAVVPGEPFDTGFALLDCFGQTVTGFEGFFGVLTVSPPACLASAGATTVVRGWSVGGGVCALYICGN